MTLPAQVFSLKKDILVVDDAPENLRVLLSALTDQGYSVRCARSGNLAIAGSQASPPDLVLLDILMPQMDGYEVCQRLKQDLRTSDVPVIFLSALDAGEDKARAFALGGDDYIAKPFNLDEVLARVKHQLDLRHRQAQLRRRVNQYRQLSHDLRSAYACLETLLHRLTEGVAVFQPIREEAERITDFKIAIANPAFVNFLQPDLEATAESPQRLTAYTDSVAGRELFQLCLQVMATGTSLKREWLLQEGDRPQWVEVCVTPLPEGVLASLHDVSEAKRRIATLEAMKSELYALATTDRLTQIANRYQFDVSFELEWQHSLREQQPLSLLIGDIDHFKRFNDICGHSVGDRCLQLVAQVLQGVIKRPTDLVARYGGEEFAILLPNTPLRGAVQIAHSIQTAIRELRLTDVPSPQCEHICLSLGITCTVPQVSQHRRELIEAADRALYSAKALGGNTCCVEMM